jgi:hypothetical protein
MPSASDGAGTPPSGEPEPPIVAGPPDPATQKDVVPPADKVRGFQWMPGWGDRPQGRPPGTPNELLRKIPRLVQFPNRAGGEPPGSLAQSEPGVTAVAAPSPQATAASIQLQQTVAVAITNALGSWAGVGQFPRPGGGAGGVERRVFHQPDHLACCPGSDRCDPGLHLGERGGIFGEAVGDALTQRR